MVFADKCFRRLVNFFISKVPEQHRRGVKYLEPLISARRKERDPQNQQSSKSSVGPHFNAISQSRK